MSTRARPPKPTIRAATKLLRRRERAAQPIPKGDRFDWVPEREIVVGQPRANRKPQEPGNA
jgi:hypothetical protein